MRALGLLLTTAGFVAGAFVAVIDPGQIAWGLFAAAVAVGALGVGVMRFATKKATSDEGLVRGRLEDVESSLAEMVVLSKRVAAEYEPRRVYELPDLLDETFDNLINKFVEAREAIAHRYGVDAYAEVMSDFAAGERYLNRVWSAAAEGYVDEADKYLTEASLAFAAASDALSRVHAGGSEPEAESAEPAPACP